MGKMKLTMKKYIFVIVILLVSISCLFCSPKKSGIINSSAIEGPSDKIDLIPGERKRLWNLGSVAYIQGTWKGVEKAQAFEIQTSYIECWRNDSECMEATAYIERGELRLIIDYYDIISWKDNKLVCINDRAECVTYTISAFFNRDDKKAYKTRTIKKNASKMCNSIIELATFELELVDCFEFWLDQQNHKIE